MAKKSFNSKSLAFTANHADKHANSKPGISQAEAVRQAIAAGKDLPTDGTEFIKSKYGIEMTNQTFSSYKSQQKARDNKLNANDAPASKSSQAVDGYLAPPAKSSVRGESNVLETLEALKPLIAQHGADQLKRMVDLLG